MKKRIKAGEIPSGSMADIAFLLLIFFLVTTTIDMDKGLGLVLPPKGEEKEIPKKNISNILLNSRGEFLLDKEPISNRDLRSVIIEKMSANDKLIFSVKTHPKAKYQSYVEVLDQLKMANATRISIAETN
jgi:biopolymer transport protein ExbD